MEVDIYNYVNPSPSFLSSKHDILNPRALVAFFVSIGFRRVSVESFQIPRDVADSKQRGFRGFFR